MTDLARKTDEPLPIEIRPGKFVLIQGIPHDLTEAEARKIANVVLAMAYADIQIARRYPLSA